MVLLGKAQSLRTRIKSLQRVDEQCLRISILIEVPNKGEIWLIKVSSCFVNRFAKIYWKRRKDKLRYGSRKNTNNCEIEKKIHSFQKLQLIS